MPHTVLQPKDLPPARGFAHVVVPAEGRTVYLAGQIGADTDGGVHGDFVEQFDTASANVASALRAAGGNPEHIVTMTVFVTDMASYRESRAALGEVWRRHFGTHYPAMAVVGVVELVDPDARVELQAIAVIP